MKAPLQSVAELSAYLQHVNEGVRHHAPNLTEVWAQVLKSVLVHAENLTVATRKGRLTNFLWITLAGQRHTLQAVREKQAGGGWHYSILLKYHSFRGPVVMAFDHESTIEEIETTFRGLAQAKQQAA